MRDHSGTKVWIHFTQRVEGMNHLPLSFDLSMSSLLYLKHGPNGWVITKHVDFHSFESILFTAPFLGYFFQVK